MKYKIDWSGRSINYSQEELETIIDVVNNADPMTQGKYLQEFERTVSNYLGVNHAFAMTNAASALELIAVLSKLDPSSEVIIPSHTYCASAIPFGRTGARIVWADIDPRTYVVSVKDLISKITPRTKMIVVVHLYGLPCEMEPIQEICLKHNIILVEDCAQAFGAKYKGRHVGTFGDYACFSLHAQKNITTLGEGGILITKNKNDAQLVPGLRHNGHVAYGERSHYWKPAMGNVDVDIEGVWPFNYSMTEVQAALGSKLIERLDSLNYERRIRAEKFITALKEFDELEFQKCEKYISPSFHLLPALYNGKKFNKTNDDFIEKISSKYGIKCIVQYYPLDRYPLFQKMGFGSSECPNADYFFDNMISFPFHLTMNELDFDYLIESTIKVLIELRTEV